jgi:spermidine synthase
VAVDSRRSLLAVLAALYTLSGLTSLAYEVLWVRMLSQQFGVSIFGVVITVAAFMAGLGAGSWMGERWRGRVPPVFVFGLLEAGVAVYALCLPWLMHFLQHELAGLAVLVPLPAWYGLQAVTALFVLFVPACALGIGFPLILRAATGMHMPVGRLYGLNTLGACAGALLPLALLPTVGWTMSVQYVAGLGGGVGLTAMLLAGRFGKAAAVPVGSDDPRIPASDLFAYAGIGAAALMLEIGWTRLYGMLMLRTEYVLAVILAVFLVGLALGSLGVRRYPVRQWWTILPLVASAWIVMGLWALPWLAEWADSVQFQSLTAALFGQGLMIAVFTLPVTLAFGAWLPLLSGRYGDDYSRTAAARLYGANALGAALGAVAAGFVLIPTIGTQGTLVVAVMLIIACGVLWADRIWLPVGGAALLIAAVPVWHLPPVSSLLPVTQAGSRDIFFHEDAVSITHVIEEKDGQRVLLADLQRMDASTAPAAVASQHNQARLPLLLHPAPHKVLFLGMGTGISAAGSLPFPELRRTAVELSQGAIIAADTWFAPVNDDVTKHMHVVHDDARHYLLRTREKYDVIVGDLFHPDLVGRGSLLSVQQFTRAADRLAPGGIFVQWLALNQFDLESLSVVLRSFHQVFPNMCLFVDGFRLAMVGSRDGLGGAPALLANLRRMDSLKQGEATGHEGPWTWLGRYWGSMELPPGPVQDEWSPRIEFGLPVARYRGELDVAGLLDWLVKHRPAVQEAEQALHVAASEHEDFERAYAATELAMRAWSAEIRGDELQSQRLLRLAYDANPTDRWIAFTLADRMLATLPAALQRGMDKRQALQAVLHIFPDDPDALRGLWHMEDAAGNPAQAAEYRSRLAALSPLDYEIREPAASR